MDIDFSFSQGKRIEYMFTSFLVTVKLSFGSSQIYSWQRVIIILGSI